MNVETISGEEFKRLCDDVYKDRFEIYEFNPAASRRDALLWMLLGCLISLLSITYEELEALTGVSGAEDYGDVIRKLLRERAEPFFDPGPYLEELSQRAGNE
ncbi:MAG TPA: hypothetical protein VF543_16770 [Pyrinomonadaceae bacterium]